jgi:hypothetical protein
LGDVAELCETQATIDDQIRRELARPDPKVDAVVRLVASHPQVLALARQLPASVKSRTWLGGESVTWLKTSRDAAPVTGTLQDYIKARTQALAVEAAAAKADSPRVAFEARLHQLQARVDTYAKAYVSADTARRAELASTRQQVERDYESLLESAPSSRKSESGLRWIQLKGEKAGFNGDLDGYVRHRLAIHQAALGEADPSAGRRETKAARKSAG